MEKCLYTREFLCALSCSVTGIIFPPAWFLVPLGFTALLYSVWFATPNRKAALLLGLVYGSVVSAAALWWVWDVLPLDRLGVSSESQIPMVLVTLLLFSGALALPFAAGTYLLFMVRQSPFAPVAAALMLAMIEYARMWMFSLTAWGPGLSLDPDFSLAALGYTLAENHYLLQLSIFGGIFGLSATLGLFSGTLAFLIRAVKKRAARLVPRAAVALLGILLILPLFLQTATIDNAATPLRGVMLSTNIPAGAGDDAYQALKPLIEEAATYDPEVVILPEAVGLDRIYPEEQERVEALSAFQPGTLIIHSRYLPKTTDREGRGQVVYEETGRGIVATRDKIFLMPIEEYVPAFAYVVYAPFDDRSISSFFSRLAGRMTPGTELSSFFSHGVRYDTLLCSELLSPLLYGKFPKEGTGHKVLVNLANNSWFHQSRFLTARLSQIARVQAVHYNAYLVAAVNDGPSLVIDPNGTLHVHSYGPLVPFSLSR